MAGSTDRTNRVFVVYGRDAEFVNSMYAFLRAVGLSPLEWEQVVQECNTPNPYVLDVIDLGMKSAGAMLVLFTGDDFACLRPELAGRVPEDQGLILEAQSRPNVIFEAGFAVGKYPGQTLFVQFGENRGFTDIHGKHIVTFDGSPESRNTLIGRLEKIGCTPNRSGSQWLSVPFPEPRSGRFDYGRENGTRRDRPTPIEQARTNLLLLVATSNDHSIRRNSKSTTVATIISAGRFLAGSGDGGNLAALYSAAFDSQVPMGMWELLGEHHDGTQVWGLTDKARQRATELLEQGEMPDWTVFDRRSRL